MSILEQFAQPDLQNLVLPRTSVVLVTPELAEMFLQNNSSNRRVSHQSVRSYADTMKAGHWKLTHQGLLIGKHNVLIDGQHRCLAVIASGVAVKMLVTYDDTVLTPKGLPIDVGNKRSTPFILGSNSRDTSAAAYYALIMRGTGSYKVAPDEIEPILRFIQPELASLSANTRRGVTKAQVLLAAVLRVKANIDEDDAHYAIEQYAALACEDYVRFSPCISSLHRQLKNDRITERSEIFSSAWRAFAHKDRHHTRLQIRNKESAFSEVAEVARTLWEGREQ